MEALPKGLIDPTSHVPVYKQIEELLRGAIRTGRLRPYSRVWSERRISETFNVSRMTARKAMTNLIQEGYLFTQKGKGTFVSDSKINQPVLTIRTFYDEMRALGLDPSSRLLEYGQCAADGVIGKDLDADPGQQILKIRRLMFGDATPYCIETKCIISDQCKLLKESAGREEEMLDVLSGRCYRCVTRFDIFIECTVLTVDESRLLGLQQVIPAFCVKRYAYNSNGQKISFTKSIYRGDLYRFRSTAQY
jgi:GntR family transcriptional regulator